MDYTRRWISPLGEILLASDGEALTGLWFEGQAHFADALDEAHEARELGVFDGAVRWLKAYFGGARPDFEVPVCLRGTPFQQTVWRCLREIPYGETSTYGEIAAQLRSQPGFERASARAVGGAVGRNPVSILVPCHRVLGADGRLTGYAGGVERKARLLRLEREGQL